VSSDAVARHAGEGGEKGGPVAVVSGGGSGIGREAALELARRGYALALLGRRIAPLEETLEAAAGQARQGRQSNQARQGRQSRQSRRGRQESSAARGRAITCDVRDAAAVEQAAAAIEARWGAANVVVPAAGVAHIAPFEELSAAAFAATLDTNLAGAFLVMQAFLPAMRRRGEGWIFAILSVAARRGFPGWAAYCASKAGLAGLLAALRLELQGSGVRLTAIYPGAADTAIWEQVPGTWDRAAMMPAAAVAQALGNALDADRRTLIEEIHLGPAGGAL
jgi:NAD(P)-dependent dehydrogenase (short-subunit alcohol dehydrogenase family)